MRQTRWWPLLSTLGFLAACSSDTASDPCSGVECSSRGFCVVAGDEVACWCMSGYHAVGANCVPNNPGVPCEGVTCSGHGTCRAGGTTPTCDCVPGYTHPDSTDPVCIASADCDLICWPDTEPDADADADADADDAADDAAEAEAVDVHAICGNGVPELGEACDEGLENSDTRPNACRTSCHLPYCGDQVVDTGEACDDGNFIDGDGCDSDCGPTGCGDGIVRAEEQCDDGNTDDTDACLSSCREATCGDMRVRTGHEECDGFATACVLECGSYGVQSCDACVLGSCVASAERCNGLDDDCDTTTDEDGECTPGASLACVTSCGGPSTQICGADCRWGTCGPAEVCNGADDDCDTATDEGFACIQGTAVSCSTSCGTTGTGTCTSACTLPTGAACLPPPEVCNGLDDDCVSGRDNGFDCPRGNTRSCTSPCSTAGTEICGADCAWGICLPPDEICNGLDDDCDTTTDEAC